jgi:short-subunit dehydrogenase
MESLESGTYALITGGSMGIGRAIALECASKGMNLFLVALPGPELEATARAIRDKYSVKVAILEIDLTDDDAPHSVFRYAEHNGIRVNMLINNAGFGIGGYFEKSPLSLDYKMIKLNNLAAVGLIHHFLPMLKTFDRSYILNMSSMEARLPSPYKTVYTGTKNFIYAYSLALREELKQDRVSVSVVCPGPVITNEDGMQRLKAQGAKAKLLVKLPEEIAEVAVRGMLRSKTVIVPGFLPRLIMTISNFIPESLKMKILERIFRVYKDMPVAHKY